MVGRLQISGRAWCTRSGVVGVQRYAGASSTIRLALSSNRCTSKLSILPSFWPVGFPRLYFEHYTSLVINHASETFLECFVPILNEK